MRTRPRHGGLAGGSRPARPADPLVGRTLRCYSLDEDDVPTQEAFIIVPESTDTLIADDLNDSLLLLDPLNRQILRSSTPPTTRSG